jgi:transcriptional regulator with XRE-family HTH domain
VDGRRGLELAGKTLGERLREAREAKGWSQTYVSQITGIHNINISNYERDFREPDVQTLALLASVYEVSLDYLITGHLRNLPLLDSEKKVVKGHFTSQTNDNVLKMDVVMVPILKEPTSPWAKVPSESIEGYLPVLTNELDLENYDYFWWRVRDDAMSGENIHKGSLVLVRECKDLSRYTNGSIRLVWFGEEITLRRAFTDGNVVALQASNPNYPLKLEYMDDDARSIEALGYGHGEVIRVVQDIVVQDIPIV